MKDYLFLILVLPALAGSAQITSPGLGSNTNTDTWLAVGFREKLDSAGNNHSLTYVGIGRESSRGGCNPLQRPGIFVVNEEIYHKFSPKWKGSLALSYRRQHEYAKTAPYGPAAPAFKQEFRFYGRISRVFDFGHVKFTQTLRQEARKFYTPDFHHWHESVQLRTRLKSQLVYAPGNSHRHRITLGAEALFTVARTHPTGLWEPFSYSETRLSCFYTFTPRGAHMHLSFGYMNDLIGTGAHFKDNHYISADLVFENLFGRRLR